MTSIAVAFAISVEFIIFDPHQQQKKITSLNPHSAKNRTIYSPTIFNIPFAQKRIHCENYLQNSFVIH